jgi:hypothetical protein
MICPRCGRPILPGQPTDDDHVIAQALGGTVTMLAHRDCNRRHGARLGNAMRANRQLTSAAELLAHPEPGRFVVLLTGPPCAGKTTAARASGLPVLDRDDPQWRGEAEFRRALRHLGATPRARAVIIRSGATTLGRAATIAAAGCTHSYHLVVQPEVSHERITSRGRADAAATHRAVADWWQRHRADPHDDHQPPWPGDWEQVPGWDPPAPDDWPG